MKQPEHLAHLCTLTALRERRLKPAPHQRPSARYWQGRHWVDLWAPEEAEPLRARREPSTSQLLALAVGRRLSGIRCCKVCGERVERRRVTAEGVCDWCQQGVDAAEADERGLDAAQAVRVLANTWWSREPCFLDLETTGLDDDAEVIEYALLATDGRVLLEGLVRPECDEIPIEARRVNGISMAMLGDAPRWPEIYPTLAEHLQGRLVIAHNARFDKRMVEQSCARAGVEMPRAEWGCTMDALIELNGGRWPRLCRAAELVGARFPANGGPHRARYDAALCREVVVAMRGLAL